VLTAEPSGENLGNMRTLGITGFLAKPFKEAALLDSVRKVTPLVVKTDEVKVLT